MATMLTPTETAELVRRAGDGDEVAWNELVRLFMPVLWGTARRFRLNDGDAADVVQTTWLRLVQHLSSIEDPSRIGGWLVTTARREAIRVSNLRKQTVPTDDASLLDGADNTAPWTGQALLDSERNDVVKALFAQLAPRHQTFLTLLMADPALSYQEISQRLDMPIGSIGPTRARCLRKLVDLATEQGLELQLLAAQ
jgi:RNA polymerase sigma factor (sigma-70 family)